MSGLVDRGELVARKIVERMPDSFQIEEGETRREAAARIEEEIVRAAVAPGSRYYLRDADYSALCEWAASIADAPEEFNIIGQAILARLGRE